MVRGSDDFTAAEWGTLKAAPLCMFALVAGADSHADKREWLALVDGVGALQGHDDEVVGAVMERVAPELTEPPLTLPGRDAAIEGLREAASLLKPRADGGVEFRTALFNLGMTIAEASGAQPTRSFTPGEGLRWIRSSGTSATEHEALQVAAMALGLA